MTATHRRAAGGAGLALAALVVGGCAQRQLVTAPDSTPTATTWTLVWGWAGLAAVIVGVLLTLPAWRAAGGARVAVAVLAAHAGAAVVGSAVLIGAAVRSWQLIEQAPDAAPEPALLRLSRVDGDTAFFALMVLVVVILGALLTLLLVLAARFAATDDVVQRGIACAVLAVEILAAGYAIARALEGADSWPYLAGATQVPVTIAAFIACWPRGLHDSTRSAAADAARTRDENAPRTGRDRRRFDTAREPATEMPQKRGEIVAGSARRRPRSAG